MEIPRPKGSVCQLEWRVQVVIELSRVPPLCSILAIRARDRLGFQEPNLIYFTASSQGYPSDRMI